MLEEIEKASSRAIKQVSQVLDHCRYDEPDNKVVQLKPLVVDSLHFLKRTIPASISIDESLDDVGNANIDVAGLHQVVLNICTNACQAMPTGGKLMIRLWKSDFENAILEISDDGIGMDEHTHDHIFDEYFSTKKATGGTGLGMSIVQKIIEDMNGSISVKSAPDNGTTISIKIPLIRQVVESSHPDPQEEFDAPHEGITIFIVDDDPSVRAMCGEIIESFHYEVRTFSDPRELVNAFGEADDKPGAVITDLSMPIMDGIELTRILRRLDQDVPIICCTGFGSESLEKEALASGVSTFARKPLRVEDFGRLLRQALEEKLPS